MKQDLVQKVFLYFKLLSYTFKSEFTNMQFDDANLNFTQQFDKSNFNQFIHNHDKTLQFLENPQFNNFQMTIDLQKFENPNTYINYLANYENSIKFLEVNKTKFKGFIPGL